MEWRLIRTLRQQRYDMVLNLADQWPSAIITKLTGAATRIGFDFPKRRHPAAFLPYRPRLNRAA